MCPYEDSLMEREGDRSSAKRALIKSLFVKINSNVVLLQETRLSSMNRSLVKLL